eukprot:TRINITY_DN969_c1_g1_i34.p1 TRINITY_DN969_c1_g1~~TRINITY_DN969_c1_g1_i34.p1  ORF type:complete len:114 (-),score=10.89 TRINITY_DN969_c1_g1_i34:3-344(-)
MNWAIITTLIGDNQIEDEGAKFIAEALKDKTNFAKLYIGNHVLIYIKNMSWAIITTLIVNNQIRDEGAKFIAEALKDKTNLTELYIGNDVLIYIKKYELGNNHYFYRQQSDWR